MKNRWMGQVLKFALVVALIIAGTSFLVMGLWNALIPAIFGGPQISFVQAVGLLVLSRLLFTGFFRSWGWGGTYAARFWQKKWEKKLAALSPEERERIRQAYAKRCGGRFWQSTQPQSQQESVAE